MRALVIGASGQVGHSLMTALSALGHQTFGTHHGHPQAGTRALDISDFEGVGPVIDDFEPDWMFFPAGLTAVDYCEDHPDEAFRLNRDAPAHAARAAASHRAGFVFYSTEYVFDGVDGPYTEDDPTRPVSVYGASKLAGELAVIAENPRSIVIRTTVVYGPEPQQKNFVYQLLRRLREGERMRVPADQISSPTYNADLASASIALAERDTTGVFNVTGPKILDRFAFAKLACEVFDLNDGLLDAVATVDLKQRASRPLRAGLKIDRITSAVGQSPRDPEAGLRAMRVVVD